MGENNFAKAIQRSAGMEQYDGHAKNILTYKEILAVILQAVVQEFDGMTLEEIGKCIDVDPEIATGRIIGDSEEEVFPWGGFIRYDIKFTVHIPKRGNLKLYMNLEAQKDYYPGYDLVTRGICYGATLLSGQLEREISQGDYDDLKKVYSIWICLNAPEKDANTITEYRIEPRVIYGKPAKDGRYDLMSVIMIRLPNHEKDGQIQDPVEKMLVVLYTIFKAQKTPEEKCKDLKNRCGIKISTEFENEVRTMCDFSEAILERGIEQGIEQGDLRAIRKMLALGYSPEEIAKIHGMDLIEKVLKETEIR